MKIKSENLALLSSDNSLKGIRAHLFIEQRRWNHYGRMPDEKAIQQIRNLITLIRKKLSIPTG